MPLPTRSWPKVGVDERPVPPFATPSVPLRRPTLIDEVATTLPCALVARRLLTIEVIARLVVVAWLVVALSAVKFWKVDDAVARMPPANVLSCENVFAVVVPKALVNAPVEELYASGYAAESEVLDTLLLKVLKSALER